MVVNEISEGGKELLFVGISLDGGYVYKSEIDAYFKVIVHPPKVFLFNGNDAIVKEVDYDVQLYRKPSNARYVHVLETYDSYLSNVLPHIKEKRLEELKFNTILYEDESCILAQDLKHTLETPYYVLFTKTNELKSLRDLNQNHLPLLKSLREIVNKYVSTAENCAENCIRAYIHYYPSIWRFHIHVNLLKDKWESTSLDYSTSLHAVITNISCVGNYYQTVELQTVDRILQANRQ